MPAKVVLQSLASPLVLGALLFAPAGTLAWPEGWAFVLLFWGSTVVFGLWLRRADPALLAERMRSPLAQGQTVRDRAVMTAITISVTAWLAFMGLDARRFGWSHGPAWAKPLGAALIVGAFVGWAQVMRANTFAASTIRVQAERGQTVITTGPYALVRHPMYAYVIALLIGAPLLLGSLWGLLGLVVVMPLLAMRAIGEEAVLTDGLPGYRDYAARVRFRFVPGLW